MHPGILSAPQPVAVVDRADGGRTDGVVGESRQIDPMRCGKRC